MKVPSLRDIFWAHRGLLSDKWEQYIPIYEAELRSRLEHGAPVSLLEIGVLNGGSLEVWHKLLPPHSRVVGMDVYERCRELRLSEGIELHIGDATQQAFVNGALGETRFDIIIDDGSHRSNDIIASFDILFGRLKPSGIYIVEDLHTSYWPAFGGGFRAEGSSIEWAKDLVDAVNADHFEDTFQLRRGELAQLRSYNTQIARIAFFDSMLVVQKYAAPKRRPFARLLTGAEFPILDPMEWVPSLPDEKLGNLLVGPSVARHLDAGFNQRLEEKNGELKQRQQELKQQEQELTRQEQELKRQEQELKQQEQELKQQEQELKQQEQELKRQEQELLQQQQEIKSLRNSTSWKVTIPLRHAGNFLKLARRRLAGSTGLR